MKICHFSAFNASGMHKVAETLMKAERKLGLDSHLVNIHEVPSAEWDKYADADIFVPHTHFPNEMRKRLTKPLKMVFLGHGTPEYIFRSSVDSAKEGYGHGDGLMLWMYWMQNADAICTFWPRHQAIMQSMCDKNTKVNLIPLGLDLEFWRGGASRGKFAGNPSVMICENSHFMKWAYDLFVCWAWVYKEIPDACLHANYLPVDQHRWFFPLVNRNGCSYGSHISPLTFAHDELRNVLKSVDVYANLVRYGDHNRMGLEASVCGAKIISYRGNPYADFWIQEGSQVGMAQELIPILKGDVAPRVKETIASDIQMAEAMIEVYEEVLDRGIMPIKATKSVDILDASEITL
jgi:hypothetical protein